MNKFDNALMDTAFTWANLSTCNRRQVGCVISKDTRILATGYNGTIAGTDNTCEDVVICTECDGKGTVPFKVQNTLHSEAECPTCYNAFSSVPVGKISITKDSVLHAEQNALMFAVKHGIKTDNTTMHCTDAPCITCAKLIAQAGITKVYYAKSYHNTEGIDLLVSVGVVVQQLVQH